MDVKIFRSEEKHISHVLGTNNDRNWRLLLKSIGLTYSCFWFGAQSYKRSIL